MKSTARILVVAAHPDDEALGCGGTMAKLSEAGHEVHVAFMADGVGSRGKASRAMTAEAKKRRSNAQKACRILGAQSPSFEPFPDNRMDSVDLLDVVQRVESLVKDYGPTTVFTHHGGDLNIDHRRVHEAVVTACRPQPKHCVRSLLFFEVPSSTEWQMPGARPAFEPNWFSDISATLTTKLKALDAYEGEMRAWPHARSAEALVHLARWRGATVGVEAAEAFMLGRTLA